MTNDKYHGFHESSVLELERQNGRHAGAAMGQKLAANTAEQQAIQQAVAGLLNDTHHDNDRRWEPRVLYVVPVSIWFKTSRPRSRQEPSSADFPKFDTEILAITTAISTAGCGVLTCYEIPASRVVVRFSGVSFHCEVRWPRRIGYPIYHYGLSFVKLLDKPALTN